MKLSRGAFALLMGGLFASAGFVTGQRKSGTELLGYYRVTFTSAREAGPIVDGAVALLPQRWVQKANQVSVYSYGAYGIYDVDFKAFGFDCRPQNGIPLAGARTIAGDSIEVVFDPQTDHGGIALRGVAAGDSIVGTWYQRKAGGIGGHFAMHRK